MEIFGQGKLLLWKNIKTKREKINGFDKDEKNIKKFQKTIDTEGVK